MGMKAMKKKAVSAKSLSKGGIADALATESGLKKSQCSQLLDTFASLATAEVKKAGKFTIPGLCMIKTRMKPQEGWPQGRLRQDHQGEGCACQEDCEGLLHLHPEEEHLKRMISRNGLAATLACRYEPS